MATILPVLARGPTVQAPEASNLARTVLKGERYGDHGAAHVLQFACRCEKGPAFKLAPA